MEKYRLYGDASKGINPFTTTLAAAAGVAGSALPGSSRLSISFLIAVLLFPIRVVVAALLLVLLLIVDALSYYVFYLALPSFMYTISGLAPLQALLLRLSLLVLGNVCVEYKEGGTQWRRPAASGVVDHRIQSGDVVLCTMQSVWDLWALNAANLVSSYNGNRDKPTSASATNNGIKCTNQFIIGFYHPVKTSSATEESRSAATAQLHLFLPGAMQRWRVWGYVWSSGALPFYHDVYIASGSSASLSSSSMINVVSVQQVAVKYHVPVLLFLEGSCTNGKGLLQMPHLKMMEGDIPLPKSISEKRGGPAVIQGPSLHAFVLDYENPAMNSVVTDARAATCARSNSTLAFLDPSGLLLAGSQARGSVGFGVPSTITISALTSSALLSPKPMLVLGEDASTAARTITAAEMEGIRRKLCDASVLKTRQPLSVGLKEKIGFLEASIAVAEGGNSQRPKTA